MIPPIFSLGGRRAFVTGGSVSIGRAIALALAEAGADVAIQYAPAADRDFGLPDAAEATCRELRAFSRPAVAIPADFAVPGAAAAAAAEAARKLGGLDILVVNASIQSRRPFADVSPRETADQIAINFSATIELLQATVPAMAANGWGRVLSIGSVNALRPDVELSVYAALKAAQANLIKNLACQYAASGVTLNTLSPGLVATERNRWRRADPGDWQAIQQRANPMGRAGRPEEMVGAALLFCSDAASFITGADLQATGGGHL